jgi:hypothetical protein
MATEILWAATATTVAIKACHGRDTTGLQSFSKNIFLFFVLHKLLLAKNLFGMINPKFALGDGIDPIS